MRDARGGLTIPAYGRGGAWIVKLPSPHFEAVPENEMAMMALAGAAGIPTPACELVAVEGIEGLPEGLRAGERAFVIRRFDRRGDDASERVHIEDFTQVFGLWPEDKYGTVSYGNIARVAWAEANEAGLRDFIERVVFNAAIGNGDMHAKNWSLIYPDGRHAQLAPAYDFVSTLTYLPAEETMALSLAGTRHFGAHTEARFRRLAHKAGLPEDIVMEAVATGARQTVAAWQGLRGELALRNNQKRAIDAQMSSLPILRETAGPRWHSRSYDAEPEDPLGEADRQSWRPRGPTP